MKNFLIIFLIFPFVNHANELSQIINKIGAKESNTISAASMGVIDFTYQRFYDEQFKILFDALPNLSKEKQKALIQREVDDTKKFRYIVWDMLHDDWEAFKLENINKHLVVFESIITDNTYIISYVCGIGTVTENSVRLLKKFDQSKIKFSKSSILTLEKATFIDDWNNFVERVTENNSVEKANRDFNVSEILIVGEISIPFMEYINECFYGQRILILDRLNKAWNNDTLNDEIFKLRKEYTVPEQNPLLASTDQWKILHYIHGKLSFYCRKIEKDNFLLLTEEGFLLKTKDNTLMNFPARGHYFKYHYDNQLTK